MVAIIFNWPIVAALVLTDPQTDLLTEGSSAHSADHSSLNWQRTSYISSGIQRSWKCLCIPSCAKIGINSGPYVPARCVCWDSDRSQTCTSCTSITTSALSQKSINTGLKPLFGIDIVEYLDYLWMEPFRMEELNLPLPLEGCSLDLLPLPTRWFNWNPA